MTQLVRGRVAGLDTLRAVAILWVMLYHLRKMLPESFGVVGQYGWMGVDLFFVLSGYLIGYQLLRPCAKGERLELWTFYRRRLFRILPAYFVVLLFYVVMPGWRESPRLPAVWRFLTFTVNLPANVDMHAFSHVWSLCVEEHFYLILPLLVVWGMRRTSARRTVLLVCSVLVAGVTIRWYAVVHTREFYRDIYYPTYTRLDGLLAGVTLALIRLFRPRWWKLLARRGHGTFCAGVVAVAGVIYLFRDDGIGETTGAAAWGTVVGLPLLALGLGMLVLSALSENGVLGRVRPPGSRMLATLAFTLYLSHKMVAHVDRLYLPHLTEGRDLKAALIYGATCLAAAACLHFLVERPFLLLRHRLDGGTGAAVERTMLSEPAL